MRYSGFRHLLEHLAENHPDDTAFIYEENGICRMTYGEFYVAVLLRSQQLQESGKTCLAVFADGSLASVIKIFASVLGGLQTVLIDTSVPLEQAKELIRYADCDTVYGRPEHIEACAPYLTDGILDGTGRILFFTSGTTSRAKAVVLSDYSLMQSAWNGSAMLPLNRDDILLSLLPHAHVFGFVCTLLWPLFNAAPIALGRGVRHYIDDCQYYHPTVISAVPSLLQFLLKQNCLNDELRLILVGAGDCSDDVMQAVKDRGIQLSFGYGLTETSSGVAISTGGDPRALDICPDDTITIADDGEILIESRTCMMQGYYKHSTDTINTVQNGVLHTGDLGYIDEDGRLHLTGRKKDILVLSDGNKIYLPEYEAELARAVGDEKIAVVLKNGRPVLVMEKNADRNELQPKINSFNQTQTRGRQIADVFVIGRPLPMTATGKLQRWKLEKEIGEL